MATVQTISSDKMTSENFKIVYDAFKNNVDVKLPLAKFLIGISKFQIHAHRAFFETAPGPLDLNIVMGKLYHECREAHNEVKYRGDNDALVIEIIDVIIYSLMFMCHSIHIDAYKTVEKDKEQSFSNNVDKLYTYFTEYLTESLLQNANPGTASRATYMTLNNLDGERHIAIGLKYIEDKYIYNMFCGMNFSYHRPDKADNIMTAIENASNAIALLVKLLIEISFAENGRLTHVDLGQPVQPEGVTQYTYCVTEQNIALYIKSRIEMKLNRFIGFVKKTYFNKFSI